MFVDESACNRFTARRRKAWAPTGTRARRRDHFIRGQRYVAHICRIPLLTTSRYTILPALSLDGVLHLEVQDHSYTAATFRSFIDGLLDNMNPYPDRNSVIVLDNASIHKSWDLVNMVEAR